ncbi:MAG: hypothetical protein ACXWU9_14855 [Telluria sp.]
MRDSRANEVTENFSGSLWVNRYPGSVRICDLRYPFRTYAEAFIDALQRAGAKVTIAATYRPPQRAYLMRCAWLIANGKADPQQMPEMAGVDIRWDHLDSNGKYSNLASIAAAKEMVAGFGIQRLGVAPSLKSRHTMGFGIDMAIAWTRKLTIQDATGHAVEIATIPRSGMNVALGRVGASYGVIKYNKAGRDEPHWSDNGA